MPAVSHEVRIKGIDSFAKVRSPVWVIVWTFFSLGIYGIYWWYQVNREMRDLGRASNDYELGDSPATSAIAVSLGALVIVPFFVSIYNGTNRVKAAQRLAGVPEQQQMNGWIVVTLMVLIVVTGIPFAVGYFQSELNKVWENEAIADQPTELIGPPAPPPPPPPPVPDPATQVPPPPPAPPPPAPAAAPAGPPAPAPVEETPEMARLDQLERLAALRDSGALTADEYETQKTKILSEL